jgi:hypothetical protein
MGIGLTGFPEFHPPGSRRLCVCVLIRVRFSRNLKVATTIFSTTHSRFFLNISRNRFINNYFVLDFCQAISILLTKILTDEKYLDKRPEARHRGYRILCAQKKRDQAV